MLLCAQPSIKRPPSHQTETTTMIQSNRRLLTAFSFTAGRENPTVSILLAIVNIPSLWSIRTVGAIHLYTLRHRCNSFVHIAAEPQLICTHCGTAATRLYTLRHRCNSFVHIAAPLQLI